MTELNPIARTFLPRARAIWKKVLERNEDFKELAQEMKRCGLFPEEIRAVQKAAKRAFWDDERREREERTEQYVLQLEQNSGEPVEAPLMDKDPHSFSQPSATEH